MKCKFCHNYMSALDTCKFCHFELDESYESYKSDDWDILSLKEEDGWEHIQILDRLRLKGIKCHSADIWFNNDMALLVGAKADLDRIARVLNVHREVLYASDGDFVIVNLYQEKRLRYEEILDKWCEKPKLVRKEKKE